MDLTRDQLATDRGPNADAIALYKRGAIRSLDKIRLSSYGYTFVATGVKKDHLDRTQN